VVVRLIDSTPALLAASLRYTHENSDQAVRVLADREGVDPETDRRPWLLITIYAAVLVLVHREWRVVGRADTDELVGVFDAYADEIGPTVSGDWSLLLRPRRGRRRMVCTGPRAQAVTRIHRRGRGPDRSVSRCSTRQGRGRCLSFLNSRHVSSRKIRHEIFLISDTTGLAGGSVGLRTRKPSVARPVTAPGAGGPR